MVSFFLFFFLVAGLADIANDLSGEAALVDFVSRFVGTSD